MSLEIDKEDLEYLKEIKALIGTSDITINGDVIIGKRTEKKDTKKLRNTTGVNSWKQKVKQRDKVCQCCGSSAHLEVHHVNPLSVYPNLGTDINNGMVLCQICHN